MILGIAYLYSFDIIANSNGEFLVVKMLNKFIAQGHSLPMKCGIWK
jgi:hypothetical protein